MKTKFIAILAALFIGNLMPAQNNGAYEEKDSIKIHGNAKVDGYIIAKHIKSPDGTVHIGDSSMTFSSYASISNPIKGGTYPMEFQSTSGATYAIGIGWGTNASAASRSMAVGYNTKAYGDNSMAFGNLAQVDADQSFAIGYNTKTSSAATYAIAFGSGYGGNPMLNSTSQSLAVGFNSNVPTFFVSGGNGTSGSYGKIGIANTAPTAMLDINSNEAYATKESDKKFDVVVYPNPSEGTVNLFVKQNFNPNNRVEVMDISGRVVFSKDFVKQNENLNLDLDNGTYLIKYSDGMRAESRALIISR